MKRWANILLIVSLVANIFLLGAIAGSVWRWTHGRGMGLHGGWRMHTADALTAPHGEAFRQAMRGVVRASLPIVRDGQAARLEAGRLLVQPQFDAAAITAAFDRARADDATLRANLEHEVVRFAATLPMDERVKLADALKTGPLRQGRKR